MVGVQIDHADERELQPKPQKLDHYPKQEVAFEAHFPHDGVAPQRGVNGRVAPQPGNFFDRFSVHSNSFHPPTAEYLRMPRLQTTRASR